MPSLPARYDHGPIETQRLSDEERGALWHSLTKLQQSWLESYLQNGYNATEAARQAGYKAKNDATFRQIGHDNRHHAKIKRLLADFWAEGMSIPEASRRLEQIASGDMGDFVSVDDVAGIQFDFDKAQQRGQLHLIKDLTLREETITKEDEEKVVRQIKLKLYDKQRATVDLLKLQGAYKDEEDATPQTVNNFFTQINNQLLTSEDE